MNDGRDYQRALMSYEEPRTALVVAVCFLGVAMHGTIRYGEALLLYFAITSSAALSLFL